MFNHNYMIDHIDGPQTLFTTIHRNQDFALSDTCPTLRRLRSLYLRIYPCSQALQVLR